MADNLIYNVLAKNVFTGATEGTSAKTSDFVDMQGADGLYVLARMGVSGTGGNTFQLAHASATSESPTSLGSTLQTGKLTVRIDAYRPSKRYVRVAVARGTAAALGDIWAIRYNLRRRSATATSEVGGFVATPT